MHTYSDDGAPEGWEQEYKKDGKKPPGGFWDYFSPTGTLGDSDEKNGKVTYIYLPNRYYEEMNIPSLEGGKYSEEEVPFDDLDIKGTTQKFLELFKDEIAHLKQWYEVEVKFGYIGWCS